MIVSRIDITCNDGSVLGAEENTRGSSKELLRPPPHVKRWQGGSSTRSTAQSRWIRSGTACAEVRRAATAPNVLDQLLVGGSSCGKSSRQNNLGFMV